MKKITKSDLRGLTEIFPVYNEDSMRKVLGGLSLSEIESQLSAALGNQGYGFTDNLGNFLWFYSYDTFSSRYTSFLEMGYVNFSTPGYFYFSDGKGGYVGYYNSVYGYGANEVIPNNNICFFAGVARIRGVSIQQVFTEYKNKGYAYNPTSGVYSTEAASFLRELGYGSSTTFDQVDSILKNNNQKVLGFAVTSYSSSTKQGLHAYVINEKNGDYYTCTESISGDVVSLHKSQFYDTVFSVNSESNDSGNGTQGRQDNNNNNNGAYFYM
jgi:hypothetical protein